MSSWIRPFTTAIVSAGLLALAGCKQVGEFMTMQRELAQLQKELQSEFGETGVQLMNGRDLRVSLIYRSTTRAVPDSAQQDSLVAATVRFVRQHYAGIERLSNVYVVFSSIGQAGAVSVTINQPYVVPARAEQ